MKHNATLTESLTLHQTGFLMENLPIYCFNKPLSKLEKEPQCRYIGNQLHLNQ